MSLPDLIEIVPLSEPVQAEITVPGSKSITNRALVLAALGKSATILQGALWSEDTQVMVECLQHLGFTVKVELDAKEFCNRTITVFGEGGRIPNAGTPEKPLELFVGNAGTAARFLSALVCLGDGVYRLHGVLRMHDRPQAALFKALRQLGYRVESEKGNDRLPATIFGTTEKIDQPRSCTVSIEESSQFASALLLCAEAGNWKIKVVGENTEESPYVAMTMKLIAAFRDARGTFAIEPDASSGSYFWAANTVLRWDAATGATRISVLEWPASGWQIDSKFKEYSGNVTSREKDLGDSIMTAIAIAPLEPLTSEPKKFTDLGRLRVQECERVIALRTELTKCGAEVIESGDSLTVHPGKLHGAEIETYNDHRMAMCFAILGLKIPGIRLKNPACVKKTFPNFFQKLAANPPAGLGATIVDSQTGQPLSGDDLFAD
jgi:3-phosphoshikimate 1-carboxyvinyltransferase